MSDPVDHVDVREFFTAVAGHACEGRRIVRRDEQGASVATTFLGFGCAGCGAWHRLGLSYARALRKPLRPYVVTTAAREVTAGRLDREPEILLAELRGSGGWDQPDPGVAMFTVMAAALGPPGNPMEERLHAMVAPIPKAD